MPSSACKTSARSEEHTSELQSHDNLVCRLLLEKKELFPPARKSTRLNSSHTLTPYALVSVSRRPHHHPLCRHVQSACLVWSAVFFFLNDPATPEISPLSLPDALPI